MEQVPFAVELLAHVSVIHVRGEVDLVNAPVLSGGILEAIKRELPVIVSLHDVTYFDMSGFHAVRRAVHEGGIAHTVVLAASPPMVHRIVELIQFSQIMPVLPSIDAALEFIQSHE